MTKTHIIAFMAFLFAVQAAFGGNVPGVSVGHPVSTDTSPAAYCGQNPFFNSGFGGQCTAFCWGRAKEKLGLSLPFTGNAQTWWSTAQGLYQTGSDAQANSIAVWSYAGLGHVAFVEEVIGDQVTLNEANIETYDGTNWGGGYDGVTKTRSKATWAARNLGSSGATQLLGYIYLNTVPASGNEIVVWGENKTPNAPLTNLTKIAAGYRHSLALKSDGSIVGWGSNGHGQATPPAGNNFIAIAAFEDNSLALKSDGSIVECGDDVFGMLTPPAGNNFIAIAASMFHGLALKSDGSIVSWGVFPEALPAGNNFIAIATGFWHGLALKSDGSIVGWGNNDYGQATPPAGNNFVAIAAGLWYSLAMKSDGSIVGWGDNAYGQATPPAGNNFIAIAAGKFHGLALKSDGSIVGWGYNGAGQATPPAENNFVAIAAGCCRLALKSDGSIFVWPHIGYGVGTPPAGNNFVAIAAGDEHCLALKSDGSIVGWGYNSHGQATPPAGNNFIAIAAGYRHSLALKSDGSIVGWGGNYRDQAIPPAGNNFIAISAGNAHSLALKSDGTLVGWGYNADGQATPPAGNDFVAIAAGGNHSLALKSDGSIVGWGYNSYGQATPPAGNNFVAIAAGYHSLALKTDGSLAGWGGAATPPAGNNFIAIAAGGGNSLALRRTRTPSPITIATPASDPSAGLRPTGLSGHLYYWDVSQNQWVSMTAVPSTSVFDPARPTIVITHGWGKAISASWVADMARQFKAIDSSANILGWDWHEKAATLSPAECASNGNVQGGLLAVELSLIGIIPAQTQLIGHSNGGGLMGSAATAIFNNLPTHSKIKRVTTLDSPNVLGIDATRFIEPNNVNEVEVYYSDNRIDLSFGAGIKGTNVFNGEVYSTAIPPFTWQHSIIHDWYTNLGDTATIPHAPAPNVRGMNWSIISPNCPSTWFAEDGKELVANTGIFSSMYVGVELRAAKPTTLKQMNFSTGEDYQGTANIVTNAVRSYVANLWANPDSQLFKTNTILSDATVMVFDAEAETVSGGSDVYLFKTITIPSDAAVMTFDMKVVTAVSDDYITLSFGDKVIFFKDITTVDSDFVTTLPILIPHLAGLTDTLLFTLHHDTDTPGSSVLLDNITFSTYTPLRPMTTDLNHDGIPNLQDFSIFASFWLDTSCSSPSWCEGGDFDQSGTVDLHDWQIFVEFWLWSVTDVDMDSAVNFTDYAIFANHWMYDTCSAPNWCGGTDFDHSGSVDMLDLATFAEYWLEGQ